MQVTIFFSFFLFSFFFSGNHIFVALVSFFLLFKIRLCGIGDKVWRAVREMSPPLEVAGFLAIFLLFFLFLE